MPRKVTVEVRDKSLTRLGTIPSSLLDLEVNLEHNAPGLWSVKMPTNHPLGVALAAPGSGIVVSVDGSVVFSGPTTDVVREATFINGVETLKASGEGDLVAISDGLAYPSPGVLTASAQLSAFDTRTGTPENLILAYISNNIGPLNTVGRRNPALRLPVPQGFSGPSLTRKARFDNLLELTSEIASAGLLGMTVRQTENGFIDLSLRELQDRSALIRLSQYNGLSQGTRVTVAAPEITRAVLAGQGDLIERSFADATTSESLLAETTWGRRIERLIDRRDLQDDNNLTAQASDELIDRGKTIVTANAVIAQEDWYGLFRDFFVGDYVVVEVDDIELKTQVRGAVIRSNSDGLRFGLVLGEQPEPDSQAALISKVSDASSSIESVQLRGNEAKAINARFRGSVQSIPNNTATTILFDSSRLTSTGDITYDVATGTWTIVTPGVWNLTAMATYAANSSGTRTLSVVCSATTVPAVTVSAAVTGNTPITLNSNVYLPTGATVRLTTTQTSGASLNINGEASGTSTFARLALVNK